MNQVETTTCRSGKKKKTDQAKTVSSWVLLLTAVLTVPAFAIIVVTAIHPTGFSADVIFVLACWLCVYLGLHIMKNPKLAVPYLLENIAFTDDEKRQCVSTITNITDEIENWKKQYEKCDSSFMNLSKQPTWGYLDELMVTLDHIKLSVAEDLTITFPDLKALNLWVTGSKSATIEAYLQALRAAYAYAKCVANDQGKDIDSLYPELDKGTLINFEKAPNHAKAFAWELLSSIRKKYPFVAAQLNHEAEKATAEPFDFFAKKSAA